MGRAARMSGFGIGAGVFGLCAVLAATAARGGTAARSAAPLGPGDHRLSLRHDGRERTYVVRVPRGQRGRRLPVLLNFHGGGGNAAGHKTYVRMDPVADREGFLAVYPSGTGRLGDRLLTWNAGRCCGSAATSQVDDVGFVLALLGHLDGLLPIDPHRIYATGLSNGAMMAYRLAVEAADRIAAIAPVAGGMVVQRGTPSRAVPVMHFHSVDDHRALYQGGLGPPFPMTKQRVDHPNIDRVTSWWAAHDGCTSGPRAVEERRTQQGTAGPAQTATKYIYAPCRDGAEVALWRFTGVGHVWPGGRPGHLSRLLGPSTQLVDANTEMWHFFSRFRLGSIAEGS